MAESVNNKRDKKGRFLPGNTLGFQKGQVANPNGRPRKEVCLTSQLKELLTQIVPGDRQNRTGVELVALAWFKAMLSGKADLIREALDRIEGKVGQPIIGERGGPIRLEIEGRLEKLRRLDSE